MDMTLAELRRYGAARERARKAELREMLMVARAAQADQDGFKKVWDLLS